VEEKSSGKIAALLNFRSTVEPDLAGMLEVEKRGVVNGPKIVVLEKRFATIGRKQHYLAGALGVVQKV
jgi:hypothetical protein